MLDLIDLATRPPADPATAIAELLATGEKITRKHLNAAMTEALGGTDAEGHWSQRDSFEALERALTLYLQAKPYGLTGFGDVAHAIRLMERLPTQSVRSEEQLQFQQFSTPADIAAIAVLMAAIGPDDVVLEPSAGNGLLVAQAPACAALQLNEIDDVRRAGLTRGFGAATITADDGAMLVTKHAALARPSVVLMNPPFARSLGRGADDLAAARHLMAALRRVRPGAAWWRSCPIGSRTARACGTRMPRCSPVRRCAPHFGSRAAIASTAPTSRCGSTSSTRCRRSWKR